MANILASPSQRENEINELYSLTSRAGLSGTCATEADAEAYFWEQSKQ